MMPAGPLMKEHRLIERMIRLMNARLAEIKQSGEVDLLFIDAAIDFLRTYADQCHHGKEDVLFVVPKDRQKSRFYFSCTEI